jgi:hypothetical protein
MASNRNSQGGGSNQGENQGGGNRGSSDRGFAGMTDDEQRDIARKGGEASARSQTRDDQGQFDGKRQSGSSGSRGGSSGGSGASGGSSSSGGSSNRGGGGSNR